MYDYNNVLSKIPTDHSNQVTIEEMVREVLNEQQSLQLIVDLGCGTGRYADFFLKNYKLVEYIGVDIDESPESKQRTRSDFKFLSYDGIHLPFEDESIDVIFMNQVLEHVRSPHLLFPEIARTLKSNGLFVGSVSQLEPYHSYSIFNYTFYGICSFSELFGLNVFKLRPGIDGITIINRHINKFILNRKYEMEHLFFMHESPINYSIDLYCKEKNMNIRETNLAKLKISGQFCFAARKSATEKIESNSQLD